MLALVSLFLSVFAQNPVVGAEDPVDTIEVGAWRMLGPLPRDQGSERRRIQVAAKEMRPGVPWQEIGETHAGPGGMRLPWGEPDVARHMAEQDAVATNPRERLLLDSGPLDLQELLPLLRANPDWADGATAFLYRPIYANAAGSQPVSVGGLGKLSMWWNGKRVLVEKNQRSFRPEAHRLELQVYPGLNHLLIQVDASELGWRFEMRSERRISNPRIHRAIDLGVDYLIDRQAIDGSWPSYDGYINGTSALAVYTLIKSGVSPRHESVLKGLAHLRKRRADRTYAVALELMAYQAGGDPQGAAGRGRAEVDLHLRPDADVPAGEGAGVEVPSLGGREGVHADGLLGVASWRGREHGGRLRHQEQGRVHPLDREAPDLDLLHAAPAADEAREGEGHDPARAAHRPDPSEPAPAASRSGASPAGCPGSRRR